MKVYKFVFAIGLINVLLPFIGVPGVYKQYVYVVTGVLAILYALVVRTIQNEKEAGLTPSSETSHPQKFHSTQSEVISTRKIEEVVEMEESQVHRAPRVKAKRPTIKAKVSVSENE